MENRENSQLRRLHRTTEIPTCYWDKGGVSPPEGTGISRGRIFPILFSAAENGDEQDKLRILSAIDKNSVAFRQLTVVEGKQTWTKKEAKMSILKEAALALRKTIVNTLNRQNPLRVWENAAWHYKWLEESPVTSHCVILALIPIIADAITLQRPEHFQWILAPRALKAIILEKTSLGEISKAKEVPWEEIYHIIGKEICEQDPSPARPVAKRGRQESGLVEIGEGGSKEGEKDHAGEPKEFKRADMRLNDADTNCNCLTQC